MRSYDVGYRKPPKPTQFKKGRSGNPTGRRKGTLNLATDLADELSERITVREDGKPRRISKQRALVKSLLAKALQGDIRAATALLALSVRETGEALERPDDKIGEGELLLVERYLPRAAKSLAKKRARK
jgi:type II secretory pathway predicted ATPase ExeA